MSNKPFATEREALNAALMSGTAEIHRAAERVPFMVAFFKGELPIEAYNAYLGRLWYVYEALEEEAERLKDDPAVGQMFSPELFRADALDADLVSLVGDDWRARIPASPAAIAYAERIHEIAASFPPGFAPHHWLRTLGYLLGQELLRKLVVKAYGVGPESLNFYAFPAIEDPKTYLRGYHARMNAIALDEGGLERFVEEGNRAFQLQIDLTSELASDFGVGEADEEETAAILDKLAAEHP